MKKECGSFALTMAASLAAAEQTKGSARQALTYSWRGKPPIARISTYEIGNPPPHRI
jgi:hypothetical protein